MLEKRFWFRRAADGWAGRVSEPVRIHWKKGKDLTGGMLDMAVKLHEAQVAAGVDEQGKFKGAAKEMPEFKALKKKVEGSSEGAMSFFAWFGHRGRWVTREESELALAKEAEEKEKRAKGEKVEREDEDEEDDFPTEEIDTDIFPEGDNLAVALAEDLWPGAIKYFTSAQEDDDLSEADFESDDDEDMSDEDNDIIDIRSLVKGKGKPAEKDGPPAKKRRT